MKGKSMSDDPNKSIGFVLTDIARLLRRNFDQRAQSLGLTRAQWLVIAHLRRRKGIRQVELAEILDIQPITLGRHIDRLEADGWVERRNDPGDRRAKRLFLTEKVAPVLKEMEAISQAVKEMALKGISLKEQEQLMDALLRMRANLSDNAQ